MTKIKIAGKSSRVDVFAVGSHFATAASVRIAGVDYRSRDVPYGMSANAITDLLQRVRAAYPDAVVA
jgi:hypothetical protein